ncbi:MAG: AAA family ATPase [Spirochaetaceae bacterium]|nr:AAA family ATPase [Spirochaetaceae bacterium]
MGAKLGADGATIIAIANQKGGVGKTVTVVQLASGLARAGFKVLAVDGDPQGNLSLFFGWTEGRDFGDLVAAAAAGGEPKASDYIAPRVRKGLDLLPTRRRNLRRELSDADFDRASPAVSLSFASLKDRYDWIILDCSPSSGALERLLLRSSEAVIVPLEFQLFSVAGLEAILAEVAACAEESRKDLKVHSLVFTKAENRLARVTLYRELFSSYHIPIYEICKSEYLPRSLEKSRTIWECAPSSFAARDYARLIERAFMESPDDR